VGRVIFLTGGTGFIGSRVAELLLEDAGVELVVLVMAPDQPAAEHILRRAWWESGDLAAAIGSRIRPIAGDVSAPRLGLPHGDYAELVRAVDVIVHAAADLRLDVALEELRPTNVDGVRHVVELARAVDRDHGLGRLVHVSTAYVAGGRTGRIDEGPPSDRWGFRSTYERSKFEGEQVAREAMRDLPVAIARPGMVVGDSRTGAITTFNTIYPLVRRYLTGELRVLPMREGQPVNIVAVDHVARAIARMTSDPAAVGVTFHLTAPAETLPTAGELVEEVCRWAASQLGVRRRRPIFLPIRRLAPLLGLLAIAGGRGSAIAALLPYLEEDRTFDRSNTDRLMGPYEVEWRDHLRRLLGFATRHGFLHRTGRTVHEQILHRLDGGLAITYHDVADGRYRSRPGAELRGDVLAAAASLRRRGVRPGDRVAVVGPNGTRYLTVDLAIGLVGAVSVPLYPTSPPDDVAGIVGASEARLLFVGAPSILDRLPPLEGVRVVSFCREGDERRSAEVESWDEFLAGGADARTEDPPVAPVGPDDVATIRYTSGTTGAPKGVVFDHRAVRWMGEAMASLVPWSARTTPATTVSFLPMNHVVEGILATYGPAYLSAPVDVWFVEDLADVPRVLPVARPVVFFGVPRVYEKLWDRFATSPAGRRYLEGGAIVRALLRPFVRRGLLRASGLHRCAQLLVGSAPASERLLTSFRGLGVEVHEAYGQTEAPLVTLNRVGRNRLGTVGEPLPDTELRIDDDGEVLVRGPQVTGGYVGDVPQPFREGWLATGDLGRITGDGALVIEGRKKDLLKTSYGKYVRASRIEGMLRELPGVREAVVIAEGRPFCAALVWIDEGDAASRLALDEGILRINRVLPHPEQVKRWAVLADPPSIASGELTPNMKLRRPVVLALRRNDVEALYRDRQDTVDEGIEVHEAPREEALT
jgi:long-chain acyl-CoA synthetase